MVRDRPVSIQVHPIIAQKYLLEIKEKLNKTPCNTKIQQKYDNLSLILDNKSMKRTVITRFCALNQTVTGRKTPPGVSTFFHPWNLELLAGAKCDRPNCRELLNVGIRNTTFGGVLCFFFVAAKFCGRDPQ